MVISGLYEVAKEDSPTPGANDQPTLLQTFFTAITRAQTRV
jgi:hypothetical protein